MIFPKKLEVAIKQVKSDLPKDELFSENRQAQQEKLDALKEIVEYVKKMDYIKSPKVKEKFAYFLRSGYNYRSTAAKFEKDEAKFNNIEVMASRVCKDLERLVGKETINMILEGKVSDAMKIFRTGTIKEPSLECFLPEILKLLPEPKFEMFTPIEECRYELQSLGILTHHGIKKILQDCNREKLAHIIYLLTRDSKRISADTVNNSTLQSYFENGHSTHEKLKTEREVLLRLFNGEFNSTDTEESVKMKDQVDKAIKMIHSNNVYHDAGADLDYSAFEEG